MGELFRLLANGLGRLAFCCPFQADAVGHIEAALFARFLNVADDISGKPDSQKFLVEGQVKGNCFATVSGDGPAPSGSAPDRDARAPRGATADRDPTR